MDNHRKSGIAMERLGRFKHEKLGNCVRVAFSVDQKRCEVIFPVDQRKPTIVWPERLPGKAKIINHVPYPTQKHSKHPTGFNDDGDVTSCVSPSCSFYGDLVKYAQFKW